NVSTIAEQFDVSRQAISLHLKILAECGLLSIKQQGRERMCEARLEKLREVNEWVAQYKQFWTHKLDALKSYLNNFDNNDDKVSDDKIVNNEKPIRKNSKGKGRPSGR